MDDIQTGRRLLALDVIRGAAIGLMVLDHTLVFLISRGIHTDFSELLRQSVTRASLPAFMVVAGALLRPQRSWRRIGQIGVAASASAVVITVCPIGLQSPDILAVLLPVLLAAPLIVRYPVQAAAVGVIQSVTWPIVWPGYQPGTVLALLAIGVLGRDTIRSWDVPAVPTLQRIGENPLRWYVGHIVAVGAIALIV